MAGPVAWFKRRLADVVLTATLASQAPPVTGEVVEAARPRAVATAVAGPPLVTRAGFEYGIPSGGINEVRGQIGASTQSDRRTLLQQLYEAYLACPWSWAAVNAIARTITAGGVVAEWDNDDGEGDKQAPPKPPSVLAMERLFEYCNPREDVRQLLRGVITDLMVFADAFIEVVWLGSVPVGLYSLDAPSMYPIADEHGTISGYKQVTEFGQIAEFEPREVIHISLDSPRSGIFGVSPTQANLLPITSWLFAAACAKEVFRKGNPPNIHVDLPAAMSEGEITRWDAQYATRNIGPRNIGTPIITKGGGKIDELQQGSIKEYLEFLDQKRDEILAGYGVPPAKAGVIESGNLGGGTGEAQDKTFRVNTCDPIAELVMEKINFHLGAQGFGVTDWSFRFGSVDMRDSKTVEDIRDMRIRNGIYTLNKARTEVGEPPVDGGDNAVLVDKQNLVLWRDIEVMSTAGIASKAANTGLEPDDTPGEGQPFKLVKKEPEPVPPALAAAAALPPGADPALGVPGAPKKAPPVPGGGKVAAAGVVSKKAAKKAKKAAPKAPVEGAIDREWAELSEAWTAAYRQRLALALDELPAVAEHTGQATGGHDHHDKPDYRAVDLGIPGDLERVTVDPGTLHVDHDNYQRARDDEHVARIAAKGKGKLKGRLGLLARRDDGTLWIIDGQHHSAAAVVLGIKKMTYLVFDSTGPDLEARVFDAWQRWDNADNPALRGSDQQFAAAGA
jgi:phage portal protein BeeE